ncbi:MAG: hypothetical protein HGA26_04820, partial [Chlorobiaceae bacterium]|nr:hypothetical protein [Chlorobiaceae bacterium]
PDKGGMTPLHAAALRRHKGIVRALLDSGARVDLPDSVFGYTALHRAVTRLCLGAADNLDPLADNQFPERLFSTAV